LAATIVQDAIHHFPGSRSLQAIWNRENDTRRFRKILVASNCRSGWGEPNGSGNGFHIIFSVKMNTKREYGKAKKIEWADLGFPAMEAP